MFHPAAEEELAKLSVADRVIGPEAMVDRRGFDGAVRVANRRLAEVVG